jgi:hypothetical protein
VTLVTVDHPTDIAADRLDLSSMSLDELAAHANAESRAACLIIEGAIRSSMAHAISAGEALLVAKERHPKNGQWKSWVVENFELGYASAANYMRVAFYREQLDHVLTVREALVLLRGLPQLPHSTLPGRFEGRGAAFEAEAKRLLKEGMPLREVARLLNVSTDTVRTHTDPSYRAAKRETRRRNERLRTAERKALAEKEKADAIRKAGGNISSAYGFVRKALVELDAALGDATDAEVRAALRSAMAGCHKAEDEIGKAVRSV